MKDWWINLSIKEKQTVSIGSIVVGIFLVYQFLWIPMTNSTQQLRKKVLHNQILLSWMQVSDQRIQVLENTQTIPAITKSSLLTTIQNELKKTSFASNATQLQQGENNSVKLHLQKVDFDNLMKWLTSLSQQKISINQMTVIASETPGMVEAELQLQSA